MKRFGIILAGGEGSRAGGNIPKQFVDLCGRPMVWWAMKACKEYDPEMELILVLHPGFFDDWDIMSQELPEEERIPHIICCGGRNRTHSVYNGLLSIRDFMAELPEEVRKGYEEEGIAVGIHDGARPLITPDMLRRGFEEVERGVGKVPAIKCVSSLREVAIPAEVFSGSSSESVDREKYVEVQTPQIFLYSDIMAAYIEREKEDADFLTTFSGFTDDASLAVCSGVEVKLYEGLPENIKVTHPIDFTIARAIMEARG